MSVYSRWVDARGTITIESTPAAVQPSYPVADDALLATSFDYLEPDSSGTWRSVALDRAEHLSFYFCSGYDIGTASGRQVDDDIAGVGC